MHGLFVRDLWKVADGNGKWKLEGKTSQTLCVLEVHVTSRNELGFGFEHRR